MKATLVLLILNAILVPLNAQSAHADTIIYGSFLASPESLWNKVISSNLILDKKSNKQIQGPSIQETEKYICEMAGGPGGYCQNQIERRSEPQSEVEDLFETETYFPISVEFNGTNVKFTRNKETQAKFIRGKYYRIKGNTIFIRTVSFVEEFDLQNLEPEYKILDKKLIINCSSSGCVRTTIKLLKGSDLGSRVVREDEYYNETSNGIEKTFASPEIAEKIGKAMVHLIKFYDGKKSLF